MKNWRTSLILTFFILFAVAIISRLIFLQVINQNFYRALAKGQQVVSEELTPERGEIFFRDGKTKLATNYSSKFLHVSPQKISDKEETSEALADILGISKKSVLEKISKDSLDETVKTKLTDEEAKAVEDLKIEGVFISEETKRYYPQKELAANVSGYLGGQGRGQYGLEEFYNEELRGEAGILEGEKDSKGRLVFLGLDEYLGAQDGSDLILTLDYNIQFLAEKLLAGAKNELNIEAGSIIVAEPDTGKILAMANFPSFDPNEYSSYKDLDIFKNTTIQKIYEPGSVFKPIVMASAINEGKITPTTVYEDFGRLDIGGSHIFNYDGRVWGKKNMTEVLEKSINTGAVFAQIQLGEKLFLEYAEKLGFFKKTEIDLVGEVFSENESLKNGGEINFATASFGQGIAITPIQLIKAFMTIANGGKEIQPHIVEKIKNSGGKEKEIQFLSGKEIFSSKTTAAVSAMMVSVIENGYAAKAKIPGYYIAGKTGTAQVPWTALGINRSGYSDKTVQSFIGFSPAFNPKFLILVKLDNPETKTAEYSALPIFKDLAKYIIDYLQIPPDY